MLENKIVEDSRGKTCWQELSSAPYTIAVKLEVPLYMRQGLPKLDESELISLTSNDIQKLNKKKQRPLYEYMFSVLYDIDGQLAWSPSTKYSNRDNQIVHPQFKDKDKPVKLGNVEQSDIVGIFKEIYRVLTKEDVTSEYIIKNHSEDLKRILGNIKKYKNKFLSLTKS